MFKLKICGYPDLDDAIALFNPTHIISAIEKIDPLPGKHLHVAVSDVAAPLAGYTLPNDQHLTKVLHFSQHLTADDRLLVHCFAGQSRSTAYAIAILIQHGLSPRAAFDHVASVRPILIPNRLIVQQTDRYFDLNGELERLIDDFYHGQLLRSPPSQAPSKSDLQLMRRLNAMFKRISSEILIDD